MKCPFCDHLENKVLDTRVQKEGSIVRRRRECFLCKERFTTQEILLLNSPLVVKKDERRENFSKDKLLYGIQAACQKRPVSLAQMESLVDRVSKWAMNQCEKEISTEAIGKEVVKELRQLDDVAYVRFASVYSTFKSVDDFMEVLGKDSCDDSDSDNDNDSALYDKL